jgi:hypothetical protein
LVTRIKKKNNRKQSRQKEKRLTPQEENSQFICPKRRQQALRGGEEWRDNSASFEAPSLAKKSAH